MPIPSLHDFPLVVLSKVKPADKRRTYQAIEQEKDETRTRKLTVFAGERTPLPGAEDMEVFLAMVALARDQGLGRTFHSSHYALLQMLKWSGSARRKRLDQALGCWRATSFLYEEEITAADGGSASSKSPRFTLLVPNLTKDDSVFGWHDLTLKILHQQPWPTLDIPRLLSLRRPTSRQLMLYLEGARRTGEFDLRQLACEHIGLSRNLAMADLKQFINSSAEDLVNLGYLAADPERFRKDPKSKAWLVSLKRAPSPAPATTPA